jgi:hypothetical protein
LRGAFSRRKCEALFASPGPVARDLLVARARGPVAGRARATPLPDQHVLPETAQHHQIAHAAREHKHDCNLRIKLSHLSSVLQSAHCRKP